MIEAISFANAPHGMEIVFDPNTMTERGYDCVHFYQEADGTQWLAGPFDANRFPGLRGVPPLIVPHSKCYIKFERYAPHPLPAPDHPV